MIDKVLLLALVVFCWSACSSDIGDPGPIDEVPHFYVHYGLDSILEHSLTAGLNNIYLFTNYTSDNEGVVTCVGTFANVQCPSDSCRDRLSFEFRNIQRGQVVSAETAFHLGTYSFNINTPASGQQVYRTHFQADTTLGYTNFYWLFDSLHSAQGSTPTFDFNIDTNSVQVDLKASRNSGPNSQVKRRILLSSQDTIFPKLDLLITPQANNYRLEAISSGAAISGLMWTNDSTTLLFQEDSLQPNYAVMAHGTTGSTNDSASASLQGLPADPGVTLRTANFTHTTTVVTLPLDTLQLGTVALEWIDALGQIWRSDRGMQQPNASFQVLDASPYELNEEGQKTWQMKVAFTCYLYNQSGQGISFSGTGVIAVAYP